MKTEFTKEDAYSMADYHERTGHLPFDISEEEFNYLIELHNIIMDDTSSIDPAGGYGLISHI